MKEANRQQITRAQHFVPKFYLRGFADDDGKLFCFDKVAGRIYATSPQNACQERDFYELSPKGGVPPVPPNTFEKALSAAESYWAPLHRELIQQAESGTISHNLLLEYAPFLAIQISRTKLHRESTLEAVQKGCQVLVDDPIKINFGDVAPPRFSLNPASMAALQATLLFDQKLIERYADGFDRHIWTVGIKADRSPLFVSDHPVARRANRAVDGRPLLGIRDVGIEFVFPLDRNKLLLILDRVHFASWRRFDARSFELNSEQLADYNGVQVRAGYQRIFSDNAEFYLAQRICADNPDYCNPKRERCKSEMLNLSDGRSFLVTRSLE